MPIQDSAQEVSRKKRRGGKANLNRSLASASLEVIQKKRAEKPEVRQAARDSALREVKERMKKVKDEKKAAASKAAKAAKAPKGRR